MKMRSLLISLGTTTLVACATTGTAPLIFGQVHVVGISLNTGTSGQAGDFTLGYKSYDLAVVPVSAAGTDGETTQIDSTAGNGGVDALSVLGQFNVSTGASSSGTTALGEFFSTGTAAQVLAIGFATNLCNSGNQKGSETTKSPAAGSGQGNAAGSSSQGQGGGDQSSSAAAGGAINCGALFGKIANSVTGTGASSSGEDTSKGSATESKTGAPTSKAPASQTGESKK